MEWKCNISEGLSEVEASGTGWEHFMDALLEKLDTKLREWKPETADQVRERVAEIMAVADQDALDILRSRAAEQEVLNLLDEPTSR